MTSTKIILSAILAFTLLVSLSSALSFNSVSNNFAFGKNSATVILTGDSINQTVTMNSPTFTDGINSFAVSVSPSAFSLNSGSQQSLSLSSNLPSSFKLGKYTTTLTASSSNSTISNASTSLVFLSGACGTSKPASSNLSIKNFDLSSDGEDDEEWKALDTITIEVDVENNGNDDIDDVYVELYLYDSTGVNQIGDADFISSDEEDVKLGKIRDDEYETATFEFKIPADFNTGSYKLALKAYSKELGQGSSCVDSSSDLNNEVYQTVSVDSQDDEGKFIIFDDIKVNPNKATCGDTVTVDFKAYNVGDDDEDQVKIYLENKALGISMFQEIKSGLDSGDGKQMSFSFTLPNNATNKVYPLELSAEYDYRSGVYRESSDEETVEVLEVFGCSVSQAQSSLSLTASSSEAKAGDKLSVVLYVSNSLSTSQQVILDINGFDSWATLSSVSDKLLNLAPGETKQVNLVFDVKSDASGQKSFKTDLIAGSNTQSKTFNVQVSGSSFVLPGNTLVWVIVGVNVILILLIIIVAVRISRR